MKNIIETTKRKYFQLKSRVNNDEFIKSGLNGNTEKVKALIEKGVDINVGFKNGGNLLHYLCQAKDIAMIEILLKNKANPNTTDNLQRSPIFISVKECTGGTHKSILGPEYSNSYDENQLQDSIHIIKRLLEYGADINLANHQGNTPLIAACIKENAEMVQFLLNHGANPAIKNHEGFDAFQYAVDYRCLPAIWCLIENAQDTQQVERYMHVMSLTNDFFYKEEKIQSTLQSIHLKMNMEKDLTRKPSLKNRKI